jgi:hypothetical protein
MLANNGDISFYDDTGTSQALYWDASTENLGIGTTSPDARLHIVNNSSNNFSSSLRLGQTYSPSVYSQIESNFGGSMTIKAGQGSGTASLNIQLNGSEKMRIDSGGAVEIGGTTNPNSSKLFVAGGAGSTAEFTGTAIAYLYFGSTESGGQTWSFRTSGSGNYGSANGDMYIVNGSGTTFMQFDTSASTVVGDFVDTSDVGLKENIVDTTDGLTKLMQLQPRKFDWKEEGKQQQVNGFIAQELETVLPNEVSGDDYDEENPYHGCKAINTSGILAVAVKAIQEQQTIIESLEARITALES